MSRSKSQSLKIKVKANNQTTFSERLPDLFQKGILSCIILMVIVVPLAFHPGSFERYPIPKLTVFKVLLLTGLILWAFKIITEKKFVFKIRGLDLPIIFYLVSSSLSFKNSLNIYAFENSIINMVLFTSFYYLVLNNVKKESVRKILFFSVITAIGISLLGIYQYITATQFNLNTTVVSTLGHSNFLAQYLIAIIPISLSLFMRSSKAEEILLLGGGALIISTCLILTFARGGWLGFVVSTGIFSLLYGLNLKKENKKENLPKNKRLALFLIFIFVLGGLLASSKSYILRSVFVSPKIPLASISHEKDSEANFKVLTAMLRFAMWKGTVNMIEEYPVFGVGLGNYPVQSPRFRTWEELDVNQDILWWAHNDYLQIAAETGIVGITAFLFLLGVFFYKGIKGIGYIGKDSKIATIGLISSLSATLTHSFFSFNLYQTVPTIFFWLCMGLVMTLQEGKEFKYEFFNSKNFPKHWIIPLKAIAGIILLSFFAIGSIAFIKPLMADIYYTRGEKAAINENWEESVPLYEEANRLSPFNAKYRYALALSLYKTGDFKGSVANGEIAYKLTPFIGDVNRILCLAHNEIGNIYASRGEFDLALSQYNDVLKLINERRKFKLRANEAIILGNELANAYYNRGNIFFKKKLYRKALADYEEALRLAPDHFYAIKAIERVKGLASP